MRMRLMHLLSALLLTGTSDAGAGCSPRGPKMQMWTLNQLPHRGWSESRGLGGAPAQKSLVISIAALASCLSRSSRTLPRAFSGLAVPIDAIKMSRRTGVRSTVPAAAPGPSSTGDPSRLVRPPASRSSVVLHVGTHMRRPLTHAGLPLKPRREMTIDFGRVKGTGGARSASSLCRHRHRSGSTVHRNCIGFVTLISGTPLPIVFLTRRHGMVRNGQA